MVNGRSIQISRHPKSSAWDSVGLVGPQIAPSEVAYVDRLFKHQNSEDFRMDHISFFFQGEPPSSRITSGCWKSPAESCCLTSSEHSLEKQWKSKKKPSWVATLLSHSRISPSWGVSPMAPHDVRTRWKSAARRDLAAPKLTLQKTCGALLGLSIHTVYFLMC